MENSLLSEFIGIMLGDGNLYSQKSTWNFQIRIAFNAAEEFAYLLHVKAICKKIFNKEFYVKKLKNRNCFHLCLSNRKLYEFLENKGLKEKRIPEWITSNKLNLVACVRGLIDTDGSIFRMSNKDKKLLRISFTNVNKNLLNDTRRALMELDYHPSKIVCGTHFFISRKEDIKRYIKEIGFNNPKHMRRLQQLAPSSSGQGKPFGS